MKFILIVSFLVLTSNIGFSQDSYPIDNHIRKDRIYFYWGWNWEWYSKSNISFTGDDYNVALKKVIAKDRQTKFALRTHFNPARATIPQYNFRVGYYLKENWDISVGIDHMKYVVQQNQVAEISGYINDIQSKYNGVYSNDNIIISEDFLKFEHTNGLNYIDTELRHTDQIIDFGKIKVDLIKGVGMGVLIPKTNTTLIEKEKYDEFQLSGYGVNGIVGINLSFSNKFFVQTEFKGGFINLPGIRTSVSKADNASQNFFFYQLNIVFGGRINLNKKN